MSATYRQGPVDLEQLGSVRGSHIELSLHRGFPNQAATEHIDYAEVTRVIMVSPPLPYGTKLTHSPTSFAPPSQLGHIPSAKLSASHVFPNAMRGLPTAHSPPTRPPPTTNSNWQINRTLTRLPEQDYDLLSNHSMRKSIMQWHTVLV